MTEIVYRKFFSSVHEQIVINFIFAAGIRWLVSAVLFHFNKHTCCFKVMISFPLSVAQVGRSDCSDYKHLMNRFIYQTCHAISRTIFNHSFSYPWILHLKTDAKVKPSFSFTFPFRYALVQENLSGCKICFALRFFAAGCIIKVSSRTVNVCYSTGKVAENVLISPDFTVFRALM